MSATIEAPSVSERNRRLTLERSMMRVRWFGVALGFFQVLTYEGRAENIIPGRAQGGALAALSVLALANVWVWRNVQTQPRSDLAILGRVAFGIDIAVVYTLVWIYNFEYLGQTWVVLTVLCLEGALRFQMRGALSPVALAVVLEPLRELAIVAGFPAHPDASLSIHVSDVTFRLGTLAMVGGVAGAIARNLEHQRRAAEERAVEAAHLAEREGRALRESAAFQKVILAGVRAEGLGETLQTMIEQIATDLGYARLAVLLPRDNGLHVVAIHGFDAGASTLVAPLENSITGRVFRTGTSSIIPDVAADPHYFAVDARTRSQATVPIRLASEIRGVLDVESDEPNGFSDEDVRRLERLCDQMALVMENARLLSAERETVERLKQLDVMKSDFVAVTSHELRTPLTSLKGAVNTLLASGHILTPAQSASMLEILGRQSERLARLVEDLLSVSQLDAATLRILIEPTPLAKVFDEALEQIGPGVPVDLDVAEDLPPLSTDGHRLAQVVRNLVENAIKFSPDGARVHLAACREGSDVAISVSDSGRGIDPEEIPHIFERFYQVGGSMGRASDGMGLGLYISERLTSVLGGTISVESEVGLGTTFTVRIPAVSDGAA